MSDDKETVEELRRQIRIKDESLHYKNLQLDAMHYIWCSGGCTYGAHRWTDDTITEEVVKAAEENVKRLRSWFNNKNHRDAMGWNTPRKTLT